jgi:7,8-dihydroneopterin aldolase/epimerase/oxygenase
MTPATQPTSFRLLSSQDPEATRERDGAPLDVVFVEGFVGHTVIGIHDTELHVAQPVRIDVAAGMPRSFACSSDRLADTIDYGSVRELLVTMLREHRHRLVEALAEAIAQRILATFHASWVRVAVAKPRKFDDVDAVGIVIERRRPWTSDRRALPGERSVLARLGAGMFPSGER